MTLQHIFSCTQWRHAFSRLPIPAVFCLFVVPFSARAQDVVIDLVVSQRVTDTIRGPATIVLKNVNRLRYNTAITRNITAIPVEISPPPHSC